MNSITSSGTFDLSRSFLSTKDTRSVCTNFLSYFTSSRIEPLFHSSIRSTAFFDISMYFKPILYTLPVLYKKSKINQLVKKPK